MCILPLDWAIVRGLWVLTTSSRTQAAQETGTPIAPHDSMGRARLLTRLIWSAGLAGLLALQPTAVRTQDGSRYRIEGRSQTAESLHERFRESQLALLEKLNRVDVEHLGR